MSRSLESVVNSTSPTCAKLDKVAVKLARFMIGCTVAIFVDAKTIAHGVVIGVFTEAGMPKLVVGGTKYDPSQVLTVTPAVLN